MTDLIAELAEVVRLSEAATPGLWHRHTDCPALCCWHIFTSPDGIYGPEPEDAEPSLINSPELSAENASYIVALVNWFRAHAAEIEADKRDAERWRFMRREITFGRPEVFGRMNDAIPACAPDVPEIVEGYIDNGIDAAMRSAKEDGNG